MLKILPAVVVFRRDHRLSPNPSRVLHIRFDIIEDTYVRAGPVAEKDLNGREPDGFGGREQPVFVP